MQWSLIERGGEREMVPACRAFGLGVLVWSPLCRGFLSGKYHRGRTPPKGSRLESWKDTYAKYDAPKNWDVIEAVVAMAKELDTTPARVALAWLLQKPEVSSIILGARDVAQLDDNLAAMAVKLSPEQMKKLDTLSQPAWGYPYDFIGGREPW